MAAPRRFLASTGMCIADGVNESENGTLASRQALLNMIHLLMERGWSREQAYCICSVAVDLKVSEVVDVPNSWYRPSCHWIFSRGKGHRRGQRDGVLRAGESCKGLLCTLPGQATG